MDGRLTSVGRSDRMEKELNNLQREAKNYLDSMRSEFTLQSTPVHLGDMLIIQIQ